MLKRILLILLESIVVLTLNSFMENVVVVDAGSSSVKVGYCGEDIPRSVFPSVVPFVEGRREAIECHDDDSFSHPIRRGIVEDWEKIEELWNVSLNEVKGQQMSVLLAESPGTPAASRQRVAQIMFETFKVPSLCLFNSSSLALFASGRTRGIVLECGAGVSNTVPVFEGFALSHAFRRLEVAGADVTAALRPALPSLSLQELQGVKERLCIIQNSKKKHEKEDAEYELPDGTTVKVPGEYRSRAPGETLFQRQKESLQNIVTDSIGMCDQDLQTDLRGAVVLAGGTTMLPGFCHRLQEELVRAYPKHDNVKVVPSPITSERGYNSQRKHAPWIGGSLFASLESFKEVRISKQEWEDDDNVVHRKSFC